MRYSFGPTRVFLLFGLIPVYSGDRWMELISGVYYMYERRMDLLLE